MSDARVQVIVAAFNSPDQAGQVMAALKEGKKEGLIGIRLSHTAAVVSPVGAVLGSANN